MATLVSWHGVSERLAANEGGGEAAGSDEGKFYLVCTAAPSAADRMPQPSSNHRMVSSPPFLLFRRKIDTLSAYGPNKGDHKEIIGSSEAKFTINATIGTYVANEDENGIVINTIRTASETQDVVATSKSTMVWRASDAVSNALKDSTGGSGAFNNSALTGAIGIEQGKVKAETAWAHYGGGTFSISSSIAGGLLNFSYSSASSSSDQFYASSQIEWKFEIMNQQQLDAFLNSL